MGSGLRGKEQISNYDLIRGTELVITGRNACAYYDMTSEHPNYYEIETTLVDGIVDIGNYGYFVNTGFEGEHVYDETYGLYFVDKKKAVYDLMHTISDDSALEDVMNDLEITGELEDFIEYYKKHKEDMNLLNYCLKTYLGYDKGSTMPKEWM